MESACKSACCNSSVHKDIPQSTYSSTLDSFFNPKAVAVVGATERPSAIGASLTRNVKGEGRGCRPVYPIHPKAKTILGLPAYPSLDACPTVPDLVVVVTPAKTVPGIIEQCVQLKVPAVIIISAGFKEVGKEGAALEKQISDIINRPGSVTRVVGPNCFGIQCPGNLLNTTFSSQCCLPGKTALISQSGAMLCAIIDWSFVQHVSFSHIISVGSMMDVCWSDLLDFLGHDDSVNCILIYMETVGDAREFLSAAREVSMIKPIVVLKSGRTAQAAAAAISHTGSLAGADNVLDACFKRVGVVRVDTIKELFTFASTVATQPLPVGPRLAILTNAGGPGVMATDAVVQAGAQTANLSEKTLDRLNTFLPPHWSHSNPIDMIGSATAETYAQSLDVVMSAEECDAVLIIQVPVGVLNAMTAAQNIKAVAQEGKKPVIACMMGGEEVYGARQLLYRSGVPSFEFADEACKMFGYLWEYQRMMADLYEFPKTPDHADAAAKDQLAKAQALISSVAAKGRTVMTEAESKQLLDVYGIPIQKTVVCKTRDEAVASARQIGFPVVVKLHSETITHKSDVGGVILGVETEAAVAQAWDQILANVTAKKGAEHFGGVVVATFVPFGAYELLLGSTSDAQLGPVVVFGSGGKLVEVVKDTAIAIPPLNRHLAENLISKVKITKALHGVRGQGPCDIARIVDILVLFSRLVSENHQIKEVDINPLLAAPGITVAVDARVVLYSNTAAPATVPKVAIRPYPVEYTWTETMKDGAQVLVRPIRHDDLEQVIEFNKEMSEETVLAYYRARVSLADRTCMKRMRKICFSDYNREINLVAEVADKDGKRKIAAALRLIRVLGGKGVAKCSFVMREGCHCPCLADLLFEKMKVVAAAEGYTQVLAQVALEVDGVKMKCTDCCMQCYQRHGFVPLPTQCCPKMVELALAVRPAPQ